MSTETEGSLATLIPYIETVGRVVLSLQTLQARHSSHPVFSTSYNWISSGKDLHSLYQWFFSTDTMIYHHLRLNYTFKGSYSEITKHNSLIQQYFIVPYWIEIFFTAKAIVMSALYFLRFYSSNTNGYL